MKKITVTVTYGEWEFDETSDKFGKIMALLGAEPEPEPAPAPPTWRRYVRGPLVIQNGKSNLPDVEVRGNELHDLEVEGGIRILDTNDLLLMNVAGHSARAEDAGGAKQFHGLHIQNSRYVTVESGVFYNNGVTADASRNGHGIHVRGDVEGLRIYRAVCHDNAEDGFQTHPEATGSIYVEGMETCRNRENDIDLKGNAGVTFRNCTLSGGENALLESITVHRNHFATSFIGCNIQVQNSKGILNLSTGEVLFSKCRFSVPHEGWWNLDDGPRFGPLLDGSILNLTCRDCVRD